MSDLRYEPGVFPLRARTALTKAPKGSARMADLDRSKQRTRDENREKRAAVKRDGHRCRLPFCPFCAEYGDSLTIQAAHVIEAKGVGGDPLLEVSTRPYLMALCSLAHAAQERHDFEVRPLSQSHLCDDLCEFWLRVERYDPETARYTPEWVLWAREVTIGRADTAEPRCDWKPLRKDREVD